MGEKAFGVDRVFQDYSGHMPILPDFLSPGDDKFLGVMKLAEAYRKLTAEPAAAAKREALSRIQNAWQRLAGFATCDAGPSGYKITITYPSLEKAQDAYSALHDIGKALTFEPGPVAPSNATAVDLESGTFDFEPGEQEVIEPKAYFEPLSNDECDDLFRQMQKSLDASNGVLVDRKLLASELENFFRLRQTVYQLRANIGGGDTAIRALEQQVEALEHNCKAAENSADAWKQAAGNAVRMKGVYWKTLQRLSSLLDVDIPAESRDTILAGFVHAVAEKLKAVAPTPEVIEGKGQAVTEEQEGLYQVESEGGVSCGWREMFVGKTFRSGERYMPAELRTFPPRVTFQPPPKPELVLVRFKGTGNYAYAVRDNDLFYYGCQVFKLSEVELSDETTGHVIVG